MVGNKMWITSFVIASLLLTSAVFMAVYQAPSVSAITLVCDNPGLQGILIYEDCVSHPGSNRLSCYNSCKAMCGMMPYICLGWDSDDVLACRDGCWDGYNNEGE